MNEEKEKEKQYVFVYGTLKRGYGNNQRLVNSKFIGEFTLSKDADFTMISAGYFPALVHTDEIPQEIHGELFEVTEDTLHGPLDRLEGYPRFYDRKLVQLDGFDKKAWVYYWPNERYNKNKHILVENGRW